MEFAYLCVCVFLNLMDCGLDLVNHEFFHISLAMNPLLLKKKEGGIISVVKF